MKTMNRLRRGVVIRHASYASLLLCEEFLPGDTHIVDRVGAVRIKSPIQASTLPSEAPEKISRTNEYNFMPYESN